MPAIIQNSSKDNTVGACVPRGFNICATNHIWLSVMSLTRGNSLPRVEGYTVLERVGQGSYSTVYKAVSKSGGKEIVAIKCVEKCKLQGTAADNIITEIKLMKLLKHEYIVQMRDFSWDDSFIYIILEYCDGGDLSCFIRKRRRLPESTCKKFLQQLAQALQYLRNNNICHMDLKPQNLLLSTKPVLRLKLADFGFSQFLSMEERRNTLRGSPLYMAPEMLLLHDYDATVDLWSVGVIMYECLLGKAPYSSSNLQELTDKIKAQKEIQVPITFGISSECRDLLTRLLQHDPKQRISFEEFFSHSYLDLEHIPGPQSYSKAVEIVCEAVECDKEKNYVDAFNYYCEALRYFVPLIQNESDIRRKNALRVKVNEYIARAENIKKHVYVGGNVKENNSHNKKTDDNITTGAAFRELNMLCADEPELCEVLESGCNAEQDNAEGRYRLALDKFQSCIRTLISVLNTEPAGRRRELLNNQVHNWIKEAERTKALISAIDLSDANNVIERGESCRLQ